MVKTKKTPELANRLEKLCRECQPKSRNKNDVSEKEKGEEEKKRIIDEPTHFKPSSRFGIEEEFSVCDIICRLLAPSTPNNQSP